MALTRNKQAGAIARQDLAGTALERSWLYGLLATIFRQAPEVDLLDRIKAPDLRQALLDAGLDLGRDFFDKPDKDLREQLAIEYTRLFLGPGRHISTHESVQLKRGSGTLWGKETVVVKRMIEAAGFDFDNDFSGIPDHLSVELEFLAKLAGVEAQAWHDRDYAGASNALRWQHQFIAKHAGKWMPLFCRKVNEQAELPFYTAFASILRRFLAGEKAEITDRNNIVSEFLAETSSA